MKTIGRKIDSDIPLQDLYRPRKKRGCNLWSHFFLSLCALVLLLPLSGCSINNLSYPEYWPQMTESRDIESVIAGKYSCKGEIVRRRDGSWMQGFADEFLIEGTRYLTPGLSPYCQHIEIQRVSSEEITIRFMKHNNEITQRRFKKDLDYHTEDGWIVLKSYRSDAKEFYLYHGTRMPRLTVNREKDLIIKETIKEILAIPLILVGEFSTEWGRFNRLK